MNKLTKGAIAIAIGVGAVFAAPLAANADTYVPGTTATVTVASTPGSRVPFTIPAGVFTPSTPITGTVSGDGADGVTAVVKAAQSGTLSVGTSDAAGGLSSSVVVPADATGTLTGTFSDGTHTATVNFVTGVLAATGTAAGLAHTGQYISLAAIWGGVGVVLLGAAFVSVRAVSRRRQTSAS